MRQYHVFIRQHELAPWHYAATCHSASKAMEGMCIARKRGFVAKVDFTPAAQQDNDNYEFTELPDAAN